MDGIDTLDALIENHRRAIRWYSTFALALVATGLVLIGLSASLLDALAPDLVQAATGTGGLLLASLSSFPIKEIIARKEKLTLLQSFRTTLQQPPGSDRHRIQELIWKSISDVLASPD